MCIEMYSYILHKLYYETYLMVYVYRVNDCVVT